MSADLCPVCGMPIISTDDGVTLDASPDLLGLYRPNGIKLTGAQITKAVSSRTAIGHRIHQCPTPEQDELFDAGPETVTKHGRR